MLLEDEEMRKNFYEVLNNFSRHLKLALESERVYSSLGQEEIDKYKRDFKFYQELRKIVRIIYSDTIDHKEYESKMQKLIDNYIAAEDVIRITNPVDILAKKGFQKELNTLRSPREKADAIRTRMTKSISAKWDENPAYYKKFSERIEKTLEDYKNKRISEREYFNRMNEIKKDYQEGYTDIEYPSNIKNKPNAQAFYGAALGAFEDGNPTYDIDNAANKKTVISKEKIGELSVLIEEIVEKYTKVDWHDNTDVHNRIEQEVEDLLFDFAEANNIDLDFQLIDKILKDITAIALRRY